MPITLSPRVVQELNVVLVSMFDVGARDAAKRMSAVLDICHIETSDTAQNIYTFMDTDFQLRDRGDSAELIVDGVKMYETRLKDGKKYKIISVELDAFEDDKVGQYKGVFYKLGMTQALGPSRLVEDTMLLAVTKQNVGGNYDGVPLISTVHPVKPGEAGSATWANKLIQSDGLTFSTFAAAWAAFAKFPGEDGRPGGNTPTKLIHGPDDEQIAQDICFGTLPLDKSGGGNQAWKGRVEPMCVPFLGVQDGAGAFWLADESSSLERPFIFQERRALRLIPLFASHEDPHVVKSRRLEWMVDGRIGAGFGYPNKILKSVKS
jgi:phage major head subunit gpT-like protein